MSSIVCCPFKGAYLTVEEQLFNSKMSSVREAVEWGFGRIANLWKFLEFRPSLKVLLSNIGHYYHVAVLLTNIRTIFDQGNQVSMYFGLQPPTLSEYMAV